MKVRFLICSLFLISFLGLKAQGNFSAAVNFKTEPTEKINFSETNIAVFYQKKIGPKSKIANTLEYSNLKVNYELNSYNFYVDQDKFNQVQNKFEYSSEIAEKTKWKLSVIPTANFQSKLDFSDVTVLGSLEISQQISSKLSVTAGAGRTSIFGAPKITPIVAFDYKMNEKTDFRIGFPDSKISYSNNDRNKFSLTNSFNGNFYHLDETSSIDDNAEKAILSQMTSALEYERNVGGNWFLHFKAGYDFNKKYNLLDSNNHKIYDYNTGNGYVLGIGIKYKQ
ncbi:DUF6268 family outer membrane beta-barrel protein [Flavobacterium nitrogenifigens]|uniref:DUF6268 domain-containing protein n=1 Tax=Flavobacterium nitrogenifigens TaxID=1617283 RepID=A0A521EZX4_9FLAO|nr:DUF6268 family outer membrane beta-barrel protein [Flavobacterium nitrogenifigens]KAF2336060.1 hypothetical protein DM397_05870 [Flavobacterium nitrogenifigens]SMO89435.1 hypothetical protein SAMN06265220_105345 [Flavobacterium nitrogenifigens]